MLYGASLHETMANDFLNKYEQKSEFTPPKSKPKKKVAPKNTKLILGVAGGTVVVVVIILLLFFLLNGKATLPNMVGWKADDVNLWATENGVMLRYTEEYSDVVEKDLVIRHTPGEGEKVEKRNFLELTVSKGPDPSILVKIPDFMNMSKQQIEAWGAENHMSKLRITAENSKTVEIGKVINFTVNDTSVVGEEVRRDSPVYVIISNGVGANGKVTLPDFTTMTLEVAQTFADDNEILLETEEVFDEVNPKGMIVSQDIAMDEVIQIGDTVILEVSKGPEIIMPNFASYDADMASSIASQNGITIMMKEKYSAAAAGKLISQSLSAGSLYDPEDIVTLTYSLGNTIMLPSYVGQGVDALSVWASEFNDKGANIKISKSYTTSNDLPGTIITQNVADKEVGISTTVKVLVSKGQIVYVPDLVSEKGLGYGQAITREKAMTLCEEAGLIPVFVEANDKSRLEGEVWSQSIAPGKEVQHGTTITLKYKPVTTTVKVPNFTGMTRVEIEGAGYHNKFTIVYEGSGDANATIESQSSRVGMTVAPGTEIVLVEMGTIVEPDIEPDIEPEGGADIEPEVDTP